MLLELQGLVLQQECHSQTRLVTQQLLGPQEPELVQEQQEQEQP